MIGALMEAIECDVAERYDAPRRNCPHGELPSAERAPTPLDFARRGGFGLDETMPLDWVAARRPGAETPLWVPFECVCVDYSRPGDRRLDCSSNGLGARFDDEGAAMKALLEVIERDAEMTWRTASLAAQTLSQVDVDTIDCDWFADLLRRARSRKIAITVHVADAVVPLPVFLCELFEMGAGPALRRRAEGSGCAATVEGALLAAVLEAAQSRLTAISGARDDGPLAGEGSGAGLGLGLPPSGGSRAIDWKRLAGSTWAAAASVADLAAALARAGYPDIGFVDLAPPAGAVRVVKAFAPGLGSLSRLRRPAAAVTR